MKVFLHFFSQKQIICKNLQENTLTLTLPQQVDLKETLNMLRRYI